MWPFDLILLYLPALSVLGGPHKYWGWWCVEAIVCVTLMRTQTPRCSLSHGERHVRSELKGEVIKHMVSRHRLGFLKDDQNTRISLGGCQAVRHNEALSPPGGSYF